MAALAASLDTKKRPLPADAQPPPKNVTRDVRAEPSAVVKQQVISRLDEKNVKVEPKVAERPMDVKPVPRPAPKAPERPALPPRVSTRAPELPRRTPRGSPPKGLSRVERPVAPPPRPAPTGAVTRATALTSLQRTPSPAPAKFPVGAPTSKSRRKYPRAELKVRARLSLADDPTRFFEASLPTVNISVGGMFLESSFFLKPGTKLLVHLELPPKGREVVVKGEVVRVETLKTGESGFALRFTEYLDGSEVALATHFLSPLLREFITNYAQQHRFEASAEYIAHTADVLAAWELKKAELGADIWALTGK